MGGGRGKGKSKSKSKKKKTPTKAQKMAKARIAKKKTAPKQTKTKRTPASTGRAPSKTPTKAQNLAKARIAAGKTISQVKASNKKSMQDAARERNKKFQAEKAAKAAAKKAAAAKKKAPAPAPKTNDVQNDTKIAGITGYGLRPDGVTGEYREGDVFNTGGKSGKDYKYEGVPGKGRFVPVKTAALGNVSNLGIGQEKTFFRQKDPASYGYPSQSEVDNAALGGGAGFIGQKPKGNPNVMSADGTFNRPGPGGPEPESDYTSYQPGSYYNQSDTNMNLTNALRSTRNLVTSPARALGIDTGLTNKLIPKSNEAIQDARDQRSQYHVGNDPRPTLTRPKSKGGSNYQMQVAPPLPPTRDDVEHRAVELLPEGSVTPTGPGGGMGRAGVVTPTPRMIDVGGGKQISADTMSDYLAALRSTWDTQAQQYQSQIGDLQGQLGGYETQVGDYQGQISGLQSDIGGYKTASERQQELLDKYQMQIGGYRTQVSDYEKSLGDYKTQIGGLQSDIGGYKSQIGSLQSDIGGYKGQIGELQGDIKGYKGEISGLRGDVLGLRGDISNYQARERKAREMQIRDAQRQRVAQSYGLGKKKPKVGGVKTGRIEEEARMFGPRAMFNRSGLRISSLNI